MFERPRMSEYRALNLGYTPRCDSRGRTQLAPISGLSRPKLFQSADAGEREDGCEAQSYTLWSADSTHDSPCLWLEKDRPFAVEVSQGCCGGACPVAVPTPDHLVRVHPEAVQSG